MYISMSVINTHFLNPVRIFEYLMNKEIYYQIKLKKTLHVFKININLDTAPPL